MKLWTIMPLDAVDALNRDGMLACDPSRSANDDLFETYDFMVSALTERVGPPPDGVRYPLWAWVARPDLRFSGHGERGTRYALIEFEIPDDDVLVSNFEAWCAVLEGAYIPLTEDDEQRFSERPDEAERVQSRSRVFDTDGPYHGSRWQATFWTLTAPMVRSIRQFSAA